MVTDQVAAEAEASSESAVNCTACTVADAWARTGAAVQVADQASATQTSAASRRAKRAPVDGRAETRDIATPLRPRRRLSRTACWPPSGVAPSRRSQNRPPRRRANGGQPTPGGSRAVTGLSGEAVW